MVLEEALEFTEPRSRIYVKHVAGRFQRLRWLAFAALLALFLVIPWLHWGERPVVLFDLPARRFYVFGLTIWPHEMYVLMGLILAMALALFFFTTLAGRLWCGYACPQTVYVSLFLEVERLVEGDRALQQRLGRKGWTPERVAKTGLKHGLFLAVALIVGYTSVAYFIPARALWVDIAGLRLDSVVTLWLALVAGTLYIDGAFFREQICLYPCPYGRFQGALTDRGTLVIGYDSGRGEPRRGRDAAPAGGAGGEKLESGSSAGDCIDCTLCVQVCPQGIDIRAGAQASCIGCARCLDACDLVMARIDKSPGLIRYDAAAVFDGGRVGEPRRKLLAYGALLVLVSAALAGYFVVRPDSRLDVTRAPGLYRTLPDGLVANLYTVRPLNMSDRAREFRVEVAGIPGIALHGPDRAVVAPGAMGRFDLAVVAPRAEAHGARPIRFTLKDAERELSSRPASFIGPEPARIPDRRR